MKKIYPYIFLLILLGSCLGYKELPVEYDYSYKGNFKKYRTYDIMKPAGPSDSTMTNEIIENLLETLNRRIECLTLISPP